MAGRRLRSTQALLLVAALLLCARLAIAETGGEDVGPEDDATGLEEVDADEDPDQDPDTDDDALPTRLADGVKLEAADFAAAACTLGVFSSGRGPKYANRRHLVRSTWGDFAKDTSIRVVFFIRKSQLTEAEVEALERESEVTKDLVVMDTAEEEEAHGSRVFAFLLWAATETTTEYVAHMDEDVWLHPYNFQRLIASLPSKKVYWGMVRTEGAQAFVAGHMVLLSRDMVDAVAERKEAVAAAVQAVTQKSSPPPGLALGMVLVNKQMLSAEAVSKQCSADYETYDWGPDKAEGWGNDDADAGFPPSETVAVHSLRSSATYALLHNYFVSGLLRWRSCVKGQFEAGYCLSVLNYQDQFTC